MVKMTKDQADRFLKKEFVREFLNKNAVKIFEKDLKFDVLEVKRSKTLNPTSYNILYSLLVNGKKISIRAATSTIWECDYNFNTLNMLYNNGFKSGYTLVARPLAFFKHLNLMFYENVLGDQLKVKLCENIDWLKAKVIQAALGLKKIHHFKKIPFHLWDHDWQFNENLISKNCPNIFKQMKEIKELISEARAYQDKGLCHGDFQPDNIIVNDKRMYIIDWGSATLAPKEMDLASFMAKIKIMLPEFGRVEDFEVLKNVFLETYGRCNQRLFDIFYLLYSIRILNSFAEFPGYEDSLSRISFACEVATSNLNKINET